MLLVGIDWAEAEHAACLLPPDGAPMRRLAVPHTPAGIRQLQDALAAAEPDAAAVLVAIERPDGLRVDALLTAGYTVYALTPQGGRALSRPHPPQWCPDGTGGRRAARPHPAHRPRPPSAAAPQQPAGRGDPGARPPG